MSEEDEDKESKTEEPSDKKKQEAKKKGQVAYTKEISSTITLIAITFLFYWFGSFFYSVLSNFMELTYTHLQPWAYGQVPLDSIILPGLKPVFYALILVLSIAFFFPIVGHSLQKGIEPKWEAAEPKWDSINPVNGVKKLVSAETLITFLKNFLRTLGLMAIFYFVMRPHVEEIVSIGSLPFENSMDLVGYIVGQYIMYALIFLLAVSGFDYYVQYKRNYNKLKMSRHEMKEEMKNTEGNPQIKGKVRQIQQERSKREIQKAVPESTVIVTNPTHYAIALKYEKGKVPIPMVSAKGVDYLAKKIREVATDNKIPIIENPPLARALYKEVKVGREIPRKYYRAVAKIIATILRLEEERKMQNDRNYQPRQ